MAQLPYLFVSVCSLSNLSLKLILLTHLLWISSLVGSLVRLPSFSIIQEHLSFQIKCADSITRIVNSLLQPFFFVLFVLAEFCRFAPRINPKEISGQVSSLLHQSSLVASFHTVRQTMEGSQSISMCCMDSDSPHRWHIPWSS